jgi:hypothetical protein
VFYFLVRASRGKEHDARSLQEENHEPAPVRVSALQLGSALTSLITALSLGTTGLASTRLAGDVEPLCACKWTTLPALDCMISFYF